MAPTASAVRRWSRALAAALAGAAVLAVAAAVVLTAVAGWTFGQALDAFVVTNGVIGLSLAVCGGLIGWYRPRNPIGWLFAVGGLAQSCAATVSPLVAVLSVNGGSVEVRRLLLTVFVWSWPWAVGLCLPLGLLLFPDGRLPSRRWRPAMVAVVVTAPLFVLAMAVGPEPLDSGLPLAYGTWARYDDYAALWMFAGYRTLAAMLLALAALVLRYRRGSETERVQLLWLLLAVVVVIGVTLPWGLVAGTPVVALLSIALVPAAVTVAIVRHQLLDIRLVVSRTLAWVVLSVAVVAAYAVLVALLDRLLVGQLGRSALLTVALVLVAAPALPRLQRLVDRALYGERANPAAVASRVGAQLSAAQSGLAGVVEAVRTGLQLPYVGLARDQVVLAEAGSPPDHVMHRPLVHAGADVGELRCAARTGERRLGPADERVLALLAAPLAAALHASVASAELQHSRERLVRAREEERRRLRRELHDGLGPTLTGLAFTADAAANVVGHDPAQAAELLGALRRETRTALLDVRRLVDDLRPPALDELGLVGALRQRAGQLGWRADGVPVRVQVDAPTQVPALPAAVEVATYRIATEALTNVVRHSAASSAMVRLSCGDRLEVTVLDDATSAEGPASWVPGVGLQAMRERAVELGGDFAAGPSAAGGRVRASFPLPVAP